MNYKKENRIREATCIYQVNLGKGRPLVFTRSTQERGDYLYLPVRGRKGETTCIQQVNLGKGRPLVFTRSTQERGDHLYLPGQLRKRETTCVYQVDVRKRRPLVFIRSTCYCVCLFFFSSLSMCSHFLLCRWCTLKTLHTEIYD